MSDDASEDPTRVESVAFETEDLDHVEPVEDFKSHTRNHGGTVHGTVRLYLDGTELTHTNVLPASFDVVDTARAQYEVVRALETAGEYAGEPFCCPCGTRGCAYIHWTAVDDGGTLDMTMKDLGGRAVGDGTYRVPRDELYRATRNLLAGVIGFAEAQNVETFPWAPWKDTPVDGREHYATVAELRRYEGEIASALRR